MKGRLTKKLLQGQWAILGRGIALEPTRHIVTPSTRKKESNEGRMLLYFIKVNERKLELVDKFVREILAS